MIRTVTEPEYFNPNTVHSEFSTEISVTTAPAPVDITIRTDPPGLRVTVDETTYTTEQVFSWTPGSTHSISVIASHESNDTRHIFANWSDGGAIAHSVTVPAGSAVYTARFTTQHRLTLQEAPLNGGVIHTDPASPDGYFIEGTQVQIRAAANGGFAFSGWSGDLVGTANPQILIISAPSNVRADFSPEGPSTAISIDAGGAAAMTTSGAGAIVTGHAEIDIDAGAAPYGTAVFAYRADGVTVSEAGVPASPPTRRARVFVDYRSSVPAIPARSDSGNVEVNTGIAVVNHGPEAATVIYTLRDIEGKVVTVGRSSLEPGRHMACYIDQLQDVMAADFELPADFGFGSLDLEADQPISVVALRGITNQRGDYLMTTTPVADLSQPPANRSDLFPPFRRRWRVHDFSCPSKYIRRFRDREAGVPKPKC